MKRLLLSIGVASSIGIALPTLSEAAPWQPINQRQAILESRIDQGIREGSLTRAEAITLRGEFNTIAGLEAQYRRSGEGLTAVERADLDRRFDALSRRIRVEKHDYQNSPGPRWVPINERQSRIFSRIEAGIQSGALTRAEAIQLRGEFNTLVQLEAEYRRSNGVFTMKERDDLDRRLDRLSQRVMIERRNTQGRL
ncbi:hypothetical protein ACXR0O_11695 [Verrucomicrobiota bacterium sgz303538]